MAKYYGTIGYAETVETEPGIWEEKFVERNYFGDLIRNTRALQNSNEVNDSINVANQISVIADPYANDHFCNMRYATIHGAKWKITNVDVQFPRLVLTVGGLYNDGE